MVFVIDDDAGVREALLRLLRSAGIDARAFASPHEFLQAMPTQAIGCILLDVAMPVMTGPQLHEELAARGIDYPVIYVSGNATVSIGVQAMKRGAVDFLEKPVDADLLLPLIARAIARHRAEWDARSQGDEARRRLAALSVRELEVMRHVIRGRLNKQIAGNLNIALKTVKVHRGRVMAKMKVRSVAELVRLCDAIGISAAADAPSGVADADA